MLFGFGKKLLWWSGYKYIYNIKIKQLDAIFLKVLSLLGLMDCDIKNNIAINTKDLLWPQGEANVLTAVHWNQAAVSFCSQAAL